MGFYQPAQLVRDARQHGVEVREVDVNFSAWECTLERISDGARHRFAVRLGLPAIEGLNKDELDKLIAARGNGYASIERLAAVAGVSRLPSSASPRPMRSARWGSIGAQRYGRRGGST